MLQIGRYKIGFASLSMVVVFIVLSLCVIFETFHQYRQEWPMPLSHIIIIYEGLALMITLVYGILVHFIISIINYFKKL